MKMDAISSSVSAHPANSFATISASKCKRNPAAKNAIAAINFVGKRPKGAFLCCVRAQKCRIEGPIAQYQLKHEICSFYSLPSLSALLSSFDFWLLQQQQVAAHMPYERCAPMHLEGHFPIDCTIARLRKPCAPPRAMAVLSVSGHRLAKVYHFHNAFRACVQWSDSKDTSVVVSPTGDSGDNSLEIKEWEFGRMQEEIAASQGIRIRRRPPTGPPKHYVGPFEFRLQNEGNTPCNILEEIVWNKDMEVSQLKERRSLLTLKKAMEKAHPVRDFVGALKASHSRTGMPALIAEVKKASPSRGVLREDFDPVEIAKAYEKGGAACLSVLTDEKYFQGSFENLEAIRNAGVKCPLLCKEFVIDAWQLYYARSKGADAVLLIAAVLPDLDIKYMIKVCRVLGLAALVEVHDEREMDRVLGIDGIQLIGINNRNLETFEVDISNTKKLLEGDRGKAIRDRGILVVGESGLFTPDDIAYVQEAGVKAVLVGESLVKQSDPTKGIEGLFGKDISV
ncbi:hypothetical protein ACLOJK_041696 [Asimina triloba]